MNKSQIVWSLGGQKRQVEESTFIILCSKLLQSYRATRKDADIKLNYGRIINLVSIVEIVEFRRWDSRARRSAGGERVKSYAGKTREKAGRDWETSLIFARLFYVCLFFSSIFARALLSECLEQARTSRSKSPSGKIADISIQW